jgi:hypothetical protein
MDEDRWRWSIDTTFRTMKKTTLCSILNLVLLVGLWIGLIAVAYKLLQWRAIWQLGLVSVIALPMSGYIVQYLLSPIVNRLIGGRLRK